jgi:hypothetical protein
VADVVQFNMRMRSDLKARLDEAASLDQRSTAALVSVILGGWLDGRGYRPSFDPTALKAPAPGERLRRAPGRQRADRKAKAYTGNLSPTVLPYLEGRDEATIDAIITGTGIPDGPGIRLVLRELLIENGWFEFVDDGGKRLWKHQPPEKTG